jgi:4'-phosphopantetheinyl transferase EntD
MHPQARHFTDEELHALKRRAMLDAPRLRRQAIQEATDLAWRGLCRSADRLRARLVAHQKLRATGQSQAPVWANGPEGKCIAAG